MKYTAIEVVRIDGNEVFHTVEMNPPKTERHAWRIEDGVNRNLNHEVFYTRLVPESR